MVLIFQGRKTAYIKIPLTASLKRRKIYEEQSLKYGLQKEKTCIIKIRSMDD